MENQSSIYVIYWDRVVLVLNLPKILVYSLFVHDINHVGTDKSPSPKNRDVVALWRQGFLKKNGQL